MTEPPKSTIPSRVVSAPCMKRLYSLLDRLAKTRTPILLIGETGVGKEVVASAIHEKSTYAEGPFRAINCGAIPANLVESTLFGHVQGAFTGAARSRSGVFQQASGGTLFLDEIGELGTEAQVALLRVLETKRVVRIGGSEEVACDARIIAATNRDLKAMVSKGQFRADLLFRINALTVEIPALRERGEEIDCLTQHFLNRVSGDSNTSFHPDALTLLRQYSWPGNIRELRNVVEYANAMRKSSIVYPEDLPPHIREKRRKSPSPQVEVHCGLREKLRDHERRLILQALNESEGNRAAAAQALRIPVRTLNYRIQVLGIRRSWREPHQSSGSNNASKNGEIN